MIKFKKGICGIDINRDSISLSFAFLGRMGPVFAEEIRFSAASGDGDFPELLKESGSSIAQAISDGESRFSFKIEKVYIKLPWTNQAVSIHEEVIPLRRRKKITSRDLYFARKTLEDRALDWDDFCLHHLPLAYGVEGRVMRQAPLGLWTRHLRLKSQLAIVKDKLRQCTQDIFANLEIPFAGFVSPDLSSLAACFNTVNSMSTAAVVNMGFDKTHLSVIDKGELALRREFAFGLRPLLEKLSERFFVPMALAREIFDRYVFLGSIPRAALRSCGALRDKEVVIRNGSLYVNLSINTLNNFVKDNIRSYFEEILLSLGGYPGITLSLLGQINGKPGFPDFLKSFSGYTLRPPYFIVNSSASFGCLRYGTASFLEKEHLSRKPFMAIFSQIYKDYF